MRPRQHRDANPAGAQRPSGISRWWRGGSGRNNQFQHLTLAEFRKVAALHVEALNHAVRGLPPERMRLHVCWGNYEGPHHRDVALGDIVDILLTARPAGLSIEGAHPRHAHEWSAAIA